MLKGCGCKICKADLGDFTNELVSDGEPLESVISKLKEYGLNVSLAILKKHLKAFEIDYKKIKDPVKVEELRPVTVNLNDVDFSKYDFDLSKPETVTAYLQKLNLKVYLNQLEIVIQQQQDVMAGNTPEIPFSTMKNLAIAFQILEKSTALGLQVNQKEAIRVVESLGLKVEPLLELPAHKKGDK